MALSTFRWRGAGEGGGGHAIRRDTAIPGFPRLQARPCLVRYGQQPLDQLHPDMSLISALFLDRASNHQNVPEAYLIPFHFWPLCSRCRAWHHQ